MTDLAQAIAEVQIFATEYPYEAGDALSWFDATVLNAVASGELIPKADAKLAVALMVEKAADHVRTSEVPREETGEGAMQRALLNYAADVVGLCDPTDALVELQALRAEVERLADKVSTEPMAGF